ncbi:hypothetical protein H5410_004369 [Solanum commersonii]|uniref:Uncharacterized protein n=1 Tax=Solanum commersonii TaxID=4109 RepID=A0A9J6B7W7_SOLCO|nr:hypothetical protein H5410_004369 [Solanum commersonii]
MPSNCEVRFMTVLSFTYSFPSGFRLFDAVLRKSCCARRAVMYKPAAKKTVNRPKTPAAENNPCPSTKQLSIGVSQCLRCPDSTLSPISNNISPTANETLCNIETQHACIN